MYRGPWYAVKEEVVSALDMRSLLVRQEEDSIWRLAQLSKMNELSGGEDGPMSLIPPS